MASGLIIPIEPPQCAIEGVVALERTIHFDGRGFLVETLRCDDELAQGASFFMSYASLTVAGAARDIDRWHYHRHQRDRYVVVTGEMLVALYDSRPESPTYGHLAVLRCRGAQGAQLAEATAKGERFDATTYLLVIPEGVYHTLKNPGPEPALLQNFPTQLYDPTDEGRAPFSEVPIPRLGNRPFSWELVGGL